MIDTLYLDRDSNPPRQSEVRPLLYLQATMAGFPQICLHNFISLLKTKHVSAGVIIISSYCYKLVQGFRVTCLLAGQYNTNVYGTITDVI